MLIASPAMAARTSSALACGRTTVRVTWRGTTGGLAGHFGELYWLRNTGAVACTVTGYPTVSFAAPIPRAKTRVLDVQGYEDVNMFGAPPRRPLPTVRLAPRGVASFWLFGEDVTGPCLSSTEMLVAVPRLTGRAVVRAPTVYTMWPYCGNAVAAFPIVPGGSGSDPPRPLREEILH